VSAPWWVSWALTGIGLGIFITGFSLAPALMWEWRARKARERGLDDRA
jgi:hypothetical protein